MQDQVKSMGEKGIKGVHVGSNLGTTEDILSGENEILLFSPEKLLTDIECRDVLQQYWFPLSDFLTIPLCSELHPLQIPLSIPETLACWIKQH